MNSLVEYIMSQYPFEPGSANMDYALYSELLARSRMDVPAVQRGALDDLAEGYRESAIRKGLDIPTTILYDKEDRLTDDEFWSEYDAS